MSATFAAPFAKRTLSPDTALKWSATFWFIILVAGQLLFAVSTAMFYALTALRGDLHAWNKHLAHGHVPGDTLGNTALAIHLVSAVLITLSGALQLIPRVRRIAPTFHRWNGRIFIATAFTVSLAGLYLQLARGTPATTLQQSAQALLALMIMLCAALALYYAIKRDFPTHRRWALRLFLVASSALFIRGSAVLTAFLLSGTGNFDATTLTGPIGTGLVFGQYCLPLAVLELYFRAQTSQGPRPRLAMAAALVALTLIMGTGIAAASAAIFLPSIRRAVDPRPSIAETLSLTLQSTGLDAALAQYHQLQTLQPKTYNFDEDELNAYGYELLAAHKYQAAIAILQLNTQTYPKSANTWDSLAEAYMDNGNIPAAETNYHKSLTLNPANRNATTMLQKMATH
jgi:tetratricopeptide (TPR) repeat protein